MKSENKEFLNGKWESVTIIRVTTYLTVVTGGLVVDMEFVLFFFRMGGLLVLSPLDDDRLVGSLFSMS